MGHCIQAIVTSSRNAEAMCATYPCLVRVDTLPAIAILPVEEEFYDAVTQARPSRRADGFMLLTAEFQEFLRGQSKNDRVAYIETDYFGGNGGQGAVVYADGEVLMPPQWSAGGRINRALKHLGVRRAFFRDRFATIHLDDYRSNEELLEAANQAN
jgi:hypothetical protein